MSHLQALQGIVSDDPLQNFPVGSEVIIQPVVYRGTEEAPSSMPLGVINWTFFEGALLCVALKTGGAHGILGTAVMVAPGLAVTAAHVFSDQFDGIKAGTTAITDGVALFDAVQRIDLEGIVAKRKADPYARRVTWYRIKSGAGRRWWRCGRCAT